MIRYVPPLPPPTLVVRLIFGILFDDGWAEVLSPPATIRIAEVSVSSGLFLLRYPDAPNLSARDP